MTDPNEDGSFWPSYVDLMTSLFAISLVLFVLYYALFTKERDDLTAQRDQLSVLADQYLRLQEIEASIRALEETETFNYSPEHERYLFTTPVTFDRGSAQIQRQYHDFLLNAGADIRKLVRRLKLFPSGLRVKYLLVIEGMASRDSFAGNFELSYDRALALYRFWERYGIEFDPDVFEVIVAGSGTEGAIRVDGANEALNQRFLIQILPRVNLVSESAAEDGAVQQPT